MKGPRKQLVWTDERRSFLLIVEVREWIADTARVIGGDYHIYQEYREGAPFAVYYRAKARGTRTAPEARSTSTSAITAT